ncbi:hypothetical protein DINM_006761 [Dirofilaria immitis]|nr:hypothetical protein [Dirofilaria immitis]
MTATPHFLLAAMTKLHHTTATATNLHSNSSISSKEISLSPPVQDQELDLCAVDQPVVKVESSSVTSRSSSGRIDDSVISVEMSSRKCHLTSDSYNNSSGRHMDSTSNNAYINNVKRRRKPDGQTYGDSG